MTANAEANVKRNNIFFISFNIKHRTTDAKKGRHVAWHALPPEYRKKSLFIHESLDAHLRSLFERLFHELNKVYLAVKRHRLVDFCHENSLI